MQTIVLLAPMYTEDERWVAGRIKDEIEKKYKTYSPYTDKEKKPKDPCGFENELFELLGRNDDAKTRSNVKKAILLSSALNYHNIMQCDGCVLVINGRTPDEGSVFWAAVAFASGKPVIIQKDDYRQFMATGDNSMVTGLTLDFDVSKDLNTLNSLIEKKINAYSSGAFDGSKISAYNKKVLDLGKKIQDYLVKNRGAGLANAIDDLSGTPELEDLIPVEDEGKYERLDIANPEIYKSQFGQNSVYCSGPLFSPADIREMNGIAAVLEKEGLETYVPHRDGTEAMIDALDIPASGFLDLKAAELITLPFGLQPPPTGSGLEQAMKNHSADHHSFEVDVFYLNTCAYFVINLNGRTPDDGAVSEAGMNFAMGKPCALYKTDFRGVFVGRYGAVHPALQMAGHLFEIVSDQKDICDSLARQLAFISPEGAKYSNKIHPQVEGVYAKGKNLDNNLKGLYSGKADKRNPWFWYRVIKTVKHPNTYFKYWKPMHVYSHWPDKPTVEEEMTN